ncbi:MAG: 1-deoxy-D-xylulose-5-phosphate synthase [Actinomycetaceae bacterium]|nr:1-deoxy-D-xylulose-5-phosphate synthase [Actinomycetaceae bacterium]
MGSLLKRLTCPADLQELTSKELQWLSKEIRRFLVDAVSKTGGHLGPNLGVVELTIALHRVFHSPFDTIIFDTGHQAYVHKLLTGRQDFSHLREVDGLSGYPSREESVHDVVENSHASTALSWALGVALAKKAQGDTSWTVAVIGDGALTGGMAWEALNNISDHNDIKLMIVVNDNGRSYAPTIGGLSHHLDALRTNPKYERTLEWGKKHLRSKGKPGEVAYEALHGMKEGIKDFIAPQEMFSDLHLKYAGPVNGHDVVATEFTLTRASEFDGPIIVHVITQKGRGYTPAESHDGDHFHAIGPIHPETGLPVKAERFGWTKIFAEEIVSIAHDDPTIVTVTAAMLEPVGLKPFSQHFPERVYDVGIAEQHAATMCAGLAFKGFHPVFAVYATFLNRAFDQVLMDVALHKCPVTIMLDRAGITGADGPSHNGMWDIAMLAIVPDLRVGAPRDESRLRELLREACAYDKGPTVLRYPKGTVANELPAIEKCDGYDVIFRSTTGQVTTNTSTAPGTPASVPTSSPHSAVADIVVVSAGAMALTAYRAAEKFISEAEGATVTVIDPRWLLPVHHNLIDRCEQADIVVTIEDGLAPGGFGSQLRDRLPMEWKGIFLQHGIPHKFLHTDTREALIKQSHMDVDSVVASVKKAMRL